MLLAGIFELWEEVSHECTFKTCEEENCLMDMHRNLLIFFTLAARQSIIYPIWTLIELSFWTKERVALKNSPALEKILFVFTSFLSRKQTSKMDFFAAADYIIEIKFRRRFLLQKLWELLSISLIFSNFLSSSGFFWKETFLLRRLLVLGDNQITTQKLEVSASLKIRHQTSGKKAIISKVCY